MIGGETIFFKLDVLHMGGFAMLLLMEGWGGGRGGQGCENLVSIEMVMKLNLEVLPHPKPYQIAWFKKGSEVEVVQRCLVPFSIGKNYSNKFLCDAVEMEACHLSFGRPWQFEYKTVHHGEKNVYAFYKNGLRWYLPQ